MRALRERCQYRCFFRGKVDSTRILIPVRTRYRPRTNKPSLRNTPRNTVQMACDDEYGPTPGSCCNFKAATFHVDAFRTDRTISPTLFGSDVHSLRYLFHRFTWCVWYFSINNGRDRQFRFISVPSRQFWQFPAQCHQFLQRSRETTINIILR